MDDEKDAFMSAWRKNMTATKYILQECVNILETLEHKDPDLWSVIHQSTINTLVNIFQHPNYRTLHLGNALILIPNNEEITKVEDKLNNIHSETTRLQEFTTLIETIGLILADHPRIECNTHLLITAERFSIYKKISFDNPNFQILVEEGIQDVLSRLETLS